MAKKRYVEWHPNLESIEENICQRVDSILQTYKTPTPIALHLINEIIKQDKINRKALKKSYRGYDSRFIVDYPEEEEEPEPAPAPPPAAPPPGKELAIVPPAAPPAPAEEKPLTPTKPETIVFEAEIIPPEQKEKKGKSNGK